MRKSFMGKNMYEELNGDNSTRYIYYPYNKPEQKKEPDEIKADKEEIKSQENNIMIDEKILNDDDLLFNLKIISEIQEGEKLSCLETRIKIDSNYYFQGFYRWWNGEDRTKTLEKLVKIIDDTFKVIDKTYESSSTTNGKLHENNSEKLRKFHLSMNIALNGLEKLKKTYDNDTSMTAALDLLMEKIRTKSEKINEIFKISK